MGVFVMGYGIVRFLIEFVRVPDAQLGYLLGGVITMGQLLSLPLVIAGLALVIFALRRNRPQRLPRRLAATYHHKGPAPLWWFCRATMTERNVFPR